MMKISTGARYW